MTNHPTNRAIGDDDDDLSHALAPNNNGGHHNPLLSSLGANCPNLQILSLRECDLVPDLTLLSLAKALRPSLLPPGPATVRSWQLLVLDPANTAASITHPCPFPRLRRLDLRGNGLDAVLLQEEAGGEDEDEEEGEGEGEEEVGPVAAPRAFRRCLRYRRRWARGWNRLQMKGRDGRVAMLKVLV
jgi:hypothetical protein